MKVIVAGSRGIHNEEMVIELLNKSPYKITEIVSGHAVGIDQIGEMWARSKGIQISLFTPHYDISNPRYAPLLRNIDMAHYADALIAIWDGESKGTQHMIDQMAKNGKPYHVYNLNDMGHPVISLGTKR
jgi:hypothetical protein